MIEERPLETIKVISYKENYSVDAFMETYSISRNTVYEEIRKGTLEIFKYNRRTFITREAAEKWLKKLSESSNKRILPSNRSKKKPNPYAMPT